MQGSGKKSPRGRLPSGKANPVDVHLGKRMRTRRLMLGLSQEEVAQAIGLTFQQIQKYEYGTNRVSTSRLLPIARALNCSPSYFFDGMAAAIAALSPRFIDATTPDPETGSHEGMSADREALTLVRSFRAIRSDKVRETVLSLAHSLGTDCPPAE